MGQYTLWCLNRVADWDRARLARALAVRGLWTSKHDVRLGSRARFDSNPGWEANRGPGVLMHEEHACNEYFVPLAVKCIGDPDGFLARLGDRMSADGRRRFEALRIDFARYFAFADTARGRAALAPLLGAVPDEQAALEGRDVHPRRRTGPYAGLYEIVASEAREQQTPGDPGRLQPGGLVARFLAWMDEQLMDAEHRAIAGVVLVQSPNHGSPLADPDNADNVSAGLLGILTGPRRLSDCRRRRSEHARGDRGAGRRARARGLTGLALRRRRRLPDPRRGDRRHPGVRARALRHPADGAQVAHRPLEEKVFTAFDDLDPTRARRSAHHPGAPGDDAAFAHLSWRDCRRRHVARRSGPRRAKLPRALAGAPLGGPALVRSGRGVLRAHRHG